MSYVLGIDIGTSGTKTVLFDVSGNPLAYETVEYPLYQPFNGWAEQNPEDWYNATIQGIKSVIGKSGINPSEIKGIGLSGQMHGLVLLDKEDKVIRPAIIWCDSRSAKECEELTNMVGKERLIEITANPALTGFTASKLLWVKNNERSNFQKISHILLPKDYVRLKLTGDYATEVSDASGMQMLDVANRCWSSEILEKLGISEDMLGKVYESVEVTGTISSGISELTGLSTSTIVVGGASDNGAAAVGTGIIREGKCFTTIGTSGVVYAHTEKMVLDKLGRVHTFCSPVPNEYHVMGVTQAAGLSLKWFKDNFCSEDIRIADEKGIDVYDILNEMAANSPIGANRLLYLPYLMGERTPHLDPNCRGVFFGLSAKHNKGDLVRAVMEGVSYSLADCFDVLSEMNITLDDMTVCGGGANSPVWRRILADLFNLQVKTIHSKQGPALGVAILALTALGEYKNIGEACDNIIKVDIKQTANLANNNEYQKYHELYKNLYKSLKDDFQKLSTF